MEPETHVDDGGPPRSGQPDARAGHRSNGTREHAGAYVVLTAAFNAALTASLLVASRHRKLPERLRGADLVLLGVATHKLSRIISKEKPTRPLRAPFTEVDGPGAPGELDEHPRGEGTRRVVGELLACPFCLDAWVANGFLSGLLLAPRPVRAVAGLFSVIAISDFLQLAYRGLERRALRERGA